MNHSGTLDELEEDLALCEEFLARDVESSLQGGGGDRGGASQRPSEAGSLSLWARSDPPKDTGGSSARRRLTDERRKEILLRLVTERRGGSSGAGALGRPERNRRVEELLREREELLAGGTTDLPVPYVDRSTRNVDEDEGGEQDTPTLTPYTGGGRWAVPLPPPVGSGPYEFDPALLYTPASDSELSATVTTDADTSLRERLGSVNSSAAEGCFEDTRGDFRRRGSLQFPGAEGTGQGLSPGKQRSPRGGNSPRKGPLRPRSASPVGARGRSGPRGQPHAGPVLQTDERAKKSRHSRHAVAAEMEALQANELTFRPRINPPAPSQSAKANPVSRQARIEALSLPKSAYWEQNARKRAEIEKEAIKECSFAPKVGRGPRHREMTAARAEPNVVDRLMSEGQDKVQKRHEAKLIREQSEMASCSFQPKTNKTKLNMEEYRPIHERVGDIQRAKNEKLARARLQQINRHSAKIAEQRRSTAAPVEGDAAAPLRVSKKEAAPVSNEEEFTFAPQINPNSQRIIHEASQKAGVPQTFMERQRQYQRQRLERKHKIQAGADDEDCTFQPAVGYNEATLGLSRRYSVNLWESEEERVERLAFVDRQRKETQAMLDEEHYRECTFRPNINEKSRMIARAKPLNELASNDRIRRAREAAERKAAEQFSRECTFKPKILRSAVAPVAENGLSVAGADPSVLLQRIAEYKRAKEERIAREREAREMEELQMCTFTPEVNPGVPSVKAQGPIVVPGLGRHLEMQELARRQKEEQARREAQTFLTNPRGSTQPFTVPVPFKLATENNNRAARAAKVKEESEAAQVAECTFSPATNHRAQRELIEAILSDNSNIHGEFSSYIDY